MTFTQTGSTICFKPYTLEEAMRGLAEAGFKSVEIGAVKGFPEHLDPDRLGPAEIDACRALLDRHGLRCVSLSGHAPPARCSRRSATTGSRSTTTRGTSSTTPAFGRRRTSATPSAASATCT